MAAVKSASLVALFLAILTPPFVNVFIIKYFTLKINNITIVIILIT